MKFLILGLFIAILISLAYSFFFLMKDDSSSHRTVNMLFVRVALTIALVLVLIYGFYSGNLVPHGL
ncbi:MAG: DUF2909 domain-containing protein [Oceanospirillaceae bacterium]|nr:DUF2909 domain-containing protein [Oceanospirillaceae bacterium]